MNPSASGWIQKFGFLSQKNKIEPGSFQSLYSQLRTLGFTYGLNTAIPDFIVPTHPLTQDERAKINLLYGLNQTFMTVHPNADFPAFLDSLYRFYKELGIAHLNLLQKMLTGSKRTDQLEKLIDSRIYPEGNILTKILNPALTNSLLFVDVLTYQLFLTESARSTIDFAREMEFLVLNITYQALNSKRMTPSDERLRELFQSSITFLKINRFKEDDNYRKLLKGYRGTTVARYFLDVACLSVWEDDTLEARESKFVADLGKDLGLESDIIEDALLYIGQFYGRYSGQLEILQKQNSFDVMTHLVQKLIKRNSKRLSRELSQSRELVYLLSMATVRELSDSERNKVKEQLADIFKSIPSLAIFMLPGGAVLLPIFIKLIPRLLPSSFDENRLDSEL